MAGRSVGEASMPVRRDPVTIQRDADPNAVLTEQIAVLSTEPHSVGMDPQFNRAPRILNHTAQRL